MLMKREEYLNDSDVRGFSGWLAENVDSRDMKVVIEELTGRRRKECIGDSNNKGGADNSHCACGNPVAGIRHVFHEYYDRQRLANIHFCSIGCAFVQYHWGGLNYLHTDHILNGLRVHLLSSNSFGFDQTIYDVFDWGGVARSYQGYLNIGSTEVARQTVMQNAGALLSNRAMNVNAISHLFGTKHAYRMNSAFTKVYSLMNHDYVIYDGRVGAALGLLVTKYLAQGANVPNTLRFRWKAGRGGNAAHQNRRDPSRFPGEFPQWTTESNHTEWNLKANWLLSDVINNKKTVFGFKGQAALRALEAALFMIGYDVSGGVRPGVCSIFLYP